MTRAGRELPPDDDGNDVFRITTIAIGLCALSAAAADPVYKWIDETGGIHYSDLPPSKAHASQIVTLEPPRAADELRESHEKLITIQRAFKRHGARRAATLAQRQLARQIADEDRQRRQELCLAARKQLESLGRHAPVFRVDDQGNWIFLGTSERQAQLEFFRAEIHSNCD